MQNSKWTTRCDTAASVPHSAFRIPHSRVTSALVLFAHGSRDPEWAAPFRAVQQKVAAMKPGLAVDLAFLEIMQPSLPEAVDALVASGQQRVTIAPLFMAQGAHLKRDLAKLVADVRERHPQLDVQLLPAVGEVDSVIDAMSAWLAQRS
jgi:sirohydrochlorin cobaltochelatase